jgi:hypothetical protein
MALTLNTETKINIGGRIEALSFSAVGLILLGRQLEQKTAQKVCVTMSFLLFTLKNKKC